MTETDFTRVAVGTTDGYRYVGVTPPLNEGELNQINVGLPSFNALEGTTIVQIDDDPSCTLIQFNNELALRSPEEASRNAQNVAIHIADTLRHHREGSIVTELEPVPMMGYRSTPFNPNTDITSR